MADAWNIIQQVRLVNTNGDAKITQEEINNANGKVSNIWLDSLAKLADGKDISVDDAIMGLALEHSADEDELGENATSHRFQVDNPEQNYQNAYNRAVFEIQRNVEKWFTMDLNADGEISEAEDKFAEEMMSETSVTTEGDLTETEYANKYGVSTKPIGYDYKSHIARWKEYVIATKAQDYGVMLKSGDIQKIIEEAKIQANRWLVKGGEGETRSLYNRTNVTSYTRLITNDAVVSCCGGDVSKPPIGPQDKESACAMIFSAMDNDKSENTDYEVKNRLAWAMFNTKPESEVAQMTSEEYSKYQSEWNAVRDMKAQDFRELLKPENKEKREQFETNAIMTVSQIVSYIDIVESTTGHNFDETNWVVDAKQFHEIAQKVNGVYGDENLLEGKTYDDILPERQKLYEYLEQNDLLMPQFRK